MAAKSITYNLRVAPYGRGEKSSSSELSPRCRRFFFNRYFTFSPTTTLTGLNLDKKEFSWKSLKIQMKNIETKLCLLAEGNISREIILVPISWRFFFFLLKGQTFHLKKANSIHLRPQTSTPFQKNSTLTWEDSQKVVPLDEKRLLKYVRWTHTLWRRASTMQEKWHRV